MKITALPLHKNRYYFPCLSLSIKIFVLCIYESFQFYSVLIQ
jgi:hypothetical protein